MNMTCWAAGRWTILGFQTLLMCVCVCVKHAKAKLELVTKVMRYSDARKYLMSFVEGHRGTFGGARPMHLDNHGTAYGDTSSTCRIVRKRIE